jgi:hypothetical protein
MDQTSLIKNILLENENLSAHFKRISKPGYTLHVMDVDVMLEKTRALYGQLLQLHEMAPKPAYTQAAQAKQPAEKAETPMQEMPESAKNPVQAEPASSTEKIIEKEEPPLAPTVKVDVEKNLEEEITSAEQKPEQQQVPHAEKDERVEEDKNSGLQQENRQADPPASIEPEKPQEPSVKKEVNVAEQQVFAPKPKTTLDLFAQEAPASLGEKLKPQKDPSIAERMEQSPISDLRSAIGINEKFLFINELFKGNLNQYNKTIDELNAFETINGAYTYLVETKVQHQWDENTAAFAKLKALIERKYR